MLYLEDFLERTLLLLFVGIRRIKVLRYLSFIVIENLPSELRDRFTETRTLDLEVQSKI